MSTLAQGFALEALRVEPSAGLVSGTGGRERLDPKVMDVLVHMAEHAGQVVLPKSCSRAFGRTSSSRTMP